MINPGLAWASGGMISTAADPNTFVRGMLGGKLFNPQVLITDPGGFVRERVDHQARHQLSGMSIYRYDTACGTVYGHTGNMPGYTAFIASSSEWQQQCLGCRQ